MAIYIEDNDVKFNSQFKNFSNKIGTYAPLLGLSAAEVTAIKADSVAVDYVLGNLVTIRTFAENYTSFKNLLLKGGEQSLGTLPVAPVFPVATPIPAANVKIRFRSILQRISRHTAYTSSMGDDLGIEAPAENFVAVQGKPTFRIEMISGYPNLRWRKGKYEGVEIWKDSGQGFVKLDRDMKPDYLDKSDLPAAGASAVWKYKMIYIIDDETTGLWSDIATIIVYGEV